MQQNGGDFKELDVLQAKANREYRKNFHEAQQKYFKDKHSNHDTIAQLKGQYNEMVEYFDNELQPTNISFTGVNNNQINDNQKKSRTKTLKQHKQNRNQISNTLNVSHDDKTDKNTKALKYPPNPYNFTKSIPSNLINNLKDIAQNNFEIKCAEAKNSTDRSKLQSNLRKFEDEYHRKMHYLRSIPIRYAQDVQKIRKELPKGSKKMEALNLLIDSYTQEIDNAKIIAGGSMPSRSPADRYSIAQYPQYHKSSSSSVSNNEYTANPYEVPTLAPTKLPIPPIAKQQTQSFKKSEIRNKKSDRNIRASNNQQQQQQNHHQQQQQQQIRQPKIPNNNNNNNNNSNNNNSNNNNNNNTTRRSLSRFSTGKFATSKSKLTNIIARLRLRARDEFKAKVNAVRDTTRRESDFANHMKLLRDEYYSAIQRINKIPTMNKEFGMKYVQSLQKAQRSLKGKDPELDDLLDYLRKEHQIQS